MRIKKGTIVLISVCVIIVIAGIISMPNIYKMLNTSRVNISENNTDKKDNSTKEEITVDSEIVKSLVYPVMHNDVSVVDNYYKNNSITVADLYKKQCIFKYL